METRSAGGVVIGDNGMLALVKSTNSKSWLFPKGHIDPGETDEEAARREIMEECGLTNLEYLDDLGEFTRPRASEDSSAEQKTIKMFLFAAPKGATLAPSMEIAEARWFSYREIPEILGTPHIEWFTKDRLWYASVSERIREAIQRD